MEKEKLVPVIRFKGFDEEWKRAIFSDFIDYERPDKYIEKLPLLEFGQIPVLTANKSFKLGYTESQNYYAKGDCILFDDFTLDSKYVNFPFMVVSSALKILSLKNSQDSLPYYFAILKNNTFESQGHARHYISIVAKTPIKISDNIEERNLIGSFFTYMNMLICYQESKLEKLQTIKQSLLDKMFAFYDQKVPEIRFKGFKNNWKNKEIDSFGDWLAGTSLENQFCTNGTHKVVNIGSFSLDFKYNDQGLRINLNNENKRFLLDKDDLVMILNDKTLEGRIIGSALLIDKDNTYLYNQRIQRLSINKTQYDSNYLFFLINNMRNHDILYKKAQGNTQIYLNWSVVSKINLPVSEQLDEQQKIGQFFSNLDSLIYSQEQKLEKLNNIKQALLEKMFC
ncbi:restriction endonuclease subunit S [Mycoplasma sp. 3137]|uniref:restriction endonuclease subunit S n=1 Tax=Mycoplasma sp. 3137 TaxID=3401687 RepID=UPI003AB02A91